jgi:hypothetical protein
VTRLIDSIGSARLLAEAIADSSVEWFARQRFIDASATPTNFCY